MLHWAFSLVSWCSDPAVFEYLGDERQTEPGQQPKVWLLHSGLRATILVVGHHRQAFGCWHDESGDLH